MANEKTLAIIKPDALEKGIVGELCKRMEDGGLKIVGIKMLQLMPKKAEGFYAVHQGKPVCKEAALDRASSGKLQRSRQGSSSQTPHQTPQ